MLRRNVVCFLSRTTAGIVSQKKRLCLWTIIEIDKVTEPMVVETGRGRSQYITSKDLKSAVRQPKSLSLSLTSSAQYFVDRLSPRDRRLLQENIQLLHTKRVTVGSTCSGTDIIIPVLKHTFSVLSKLFNVPQLTTVSVWFFIS